LYILHKTLFFKLILFCSY